MKKIFIIMLICLAPFLYAKSSALPLIKVLCYHNIKPNPKYLYDVALADFEKHLTFLKNEGFISLTASQLIQALQNQKTLDPEKSYVVLTFDDGNDGVFEHAYPLLKKYQFKATLYIYPSIIFARMQKKRKAFMTWDQIKTMLQDPLIELGSHSYYHPFMTKETPQGLKHNTIKAAKTLEKKLGFFPKTFAFPFGLRNQKVIEALKEAGYMGAFTIDGTTLKSKDSLFEIPRNMITKQTRFETFQRIALGKKLIQKKTKKIASKNSKKKTKI